MSMYAAPGFAVPGGAVPGGVLPSPIQVRSTSVEVIFNGVTVPLDTILSVRCQYGWEQPVSTADITLDQYPVAGGTYHDPITVSVNGILRFTGILSDTDYNLNRTVVLKARGDLCKAEEYDNQDGTLLDDQVDPGIDLQTLLGGPSSGTLKEITLAVLTICGVDTSNSANWADPPHVYGLEADEEFTWKWGTSALSYLHSLFEASAGYRLFHSGDGLLWLAQIIGRPRSGPYDLWLRQGVDILDGAKMNRSIIQQRNIVIVKGLDDGSPTGPLEQSVVHGTTFPPDRVFTVSSSLIEDEPFALEMAEFWIDEVDRELVTGSIPTWRSDVMGPAQCHLVDALDRLGTGEKMWVTGLTLEISETGQFTQTVTYMGGGLEANYVPVPI